MKLLQSVQLAICFRYRVIEGVAHTHREGERERERLRKNRECSHSHGINNKLCFFPVVEKSKIRATGCNYFSHVCKPEPEPWQVQLNINIGGTSAPQILVVCVVI